MNILQKGYKLFSNVITEKEVDKLFSELKDVELLPYFHLNLEMKNFEDKVVIYQPSNPKNIQDILINSKNRTAQFRYKMMTENTCNIGLVKKFFPNVLKIISKTFNNHELDEDKSTFNIQVYMPFDEIPKHIDGQVENRFGAVILPITNKPKDAIGGDLILYDTEDDCPHTIESKIGDMILIDFEKNDVFHEVTNVQNWIRGSIIGFLFKK